MKKLALIVSFLIVSLVLSATVVEPERALQVAKSFVPSQPALKKGTKKAITSESEIVYTHYMPKSGKPAIYVVNIGDAFALVSADDVAHPILGYNNSKSWPKDGNLPPQVKSFLDDLAAQMEAAAGTTPDAEILAEWQNPTKRARRSTKSTTDNLPDSVGPLLTTTWDQGQYYNALCPEDQDGPDGHVYTGCVATAMAQIINYWGQKGQIKTRGIHSYQSNYGELRVNYDSTSYDFAHMPNQLTASSTQQEKDAVAKLMYECGVALNMQYAPNASGAYDVTTRATLVNFFCFSPNVSFAEKSFFTTQQWTNLMRINLANGHPVYYSGSNETTGHAFVCDGYATDDYYHFNFGWGGAADGWYLTDAVFGFNKSQLALVDIIPEYSNIILNHPTEGKSTFVVNEPMLYCDANWNNAYSSPMQHMGNGVVLFVTKNEEKEIFVDILNFDATQMYIYDVGESREFLRDLDNGPNNDFSPIISSSGSVEIDCFYNTGEGFQLAIGRRGDCHNASNLTMKNIEVEGQHAVLLDWYAYDSVMQWQIRYRNHEINETYEMVTTCNHSDTIYELSLGNTYEFGVRAFCDETHHSEWNTIVKKVDVPLWTDMVLNQPEGYQEDDEGNVYISSAEGLTWLSVLVNGLHGNDTLFFNEKTISLMADIDLSGYRWFPIAGLETYYTSFGGIFEGNNHTISNINVEDFRYGGLFGAVGRIACIRNVHLKGGMISNAEYAGGLIGISWAREIVNCSSDVCVKQSTFAGALCGRIEGLNYEHTVTMSNCSASGKIYGGTWNGGLIGSVSGSAIVQNCYSVGFTYGNVCVGGLIGALWHNAVVRNCYFAGKIGTDEEHTYNGKAIDSMSPDCTTANIYNINSDFTPHPTIENIQILSLPVTINDSTYNSLLGALNAFVEEEKSPMLCTWVKDTSNTNNGYPIFGERYKSKCYAPEEVTISDATNIGDTAVTTHIAWKQQGDAVSWEILYVTPSLSIDSGTIISTNDNPFETTALPTGELLDIYVRSVDGANNKSDWSIPLRYIPDILHWKDVLTSKPEGFRVDHDYDEERDIDYYDVHVSSAEGLAWLAVELNKLYEYPDDFGMWSGRDQSQYSIVPGSDEFQIRTINLEADVDMSAYRWTPIRGEFVTSDSTVGDLRVVFDGHGHTINGIYCNEKDDYQGFFRSMRWSTFKNTIFTNMHIRGLLYCGGIAAQIGWSQVYNCMLTGKIDGYGFVGGITGHSYRSYLNNMAFLGSISVRNDVSLPKNNWNFGGIVGSPCDKGSINNAYVVSEPPSLPNSGIVAGVGDWQKQHRSNNTYALFYPTLLHLTGDNTDANSSFFEGSNYSWTLNTPPVINNVYYTDLVDALNAWVEANDSNGVYRYWIADSLMINRGFPIFRAISNPTCVITFKNEDGTILQKDTLKIGAIPHYIGPTPTKSATPQYTYNFKGWKPEVVAVTGDAVYTAEFDSVVNQYTITFNNYDGTELQSSKHDYGAMPAYAGVTPQRLTTAQYTYTFKGWSPEFVAITSDAVYTAEFDSVVNKYLVVFIDERGVELKRDSVRYGDVAVAPIPKTYEGYEFIGWSNSFDYITSDITILAYYEMAMYYIEFVDWDGTLLQGESVWYNQLPVYHSAEPAHPSTQQYSYTFKGWIPTLVPATEETIYVADYDSILNRYSVSFTNEDGMLLQSDSVEYGAIPAYNGTTPQKSSTIQYTYTFKGWKPEVVAVSCDAVYTAEFDSVVNQYTITFMNADSTIMMSEPFAYGSMPSTHGDEPYKPITAEYTYFFVGWTPDFVPVTGDATYTPIFDSVLNTHVVTFVNDFGTELKRDTVPYGFAAIAPILSDIEGWDFIGWSVDFSHVTSDMVVTAQYEMQRFYIVFKNYDGTLLWDNMFFYNHMPEYNGETPPTRPTTPQYTYTFKGWTPSLAPVTKEAIYVANYDSILNQYAITFLDEDGMPLMTDSVAYGTMPVFDSAIPTKSANEQYTYIFAGWTPEVVAVTQDATYMAIYDSVRMYSWHVESCNIAMGSISTVFTDTAYAEGTSLSAEAAPLSGYHFVKWNDGKTINPYVLTIAADTYLLAIFAPNNTTIDETQVFPTTTTATFTWPLIVNGYTYTLTVYLDADMTIPFCDILFDESGHFVNRTLYKSAIRKAVQEGGAFTYTITDLQPETQYYFRMKAADIQNHLLNTDEGSFITKNTPSDMDNINAGVGENVKIFRNGHLYILRDGILYNAHGARVE